jgi:HSP20 family protein
MEVANTASARQPLSQRKEQTMFLTTRNYSRDAGTGVSNLTDRIQRMVNETLGGLDWQYRDSAAASWVPAVDVFEETDNIRITAEIPGVQAEDIDISLEGNLLTIRGTKQQEAEEKTERVHRYERIYGAFERSFTLPASVEPKDIKASYDNGVLTVTLPKSERAKPRQIEVEVGGGKSRGKTSRQVEVTQSQNSQRAQSVQSR